MCACGWDETPIENHLYAIPLAGDRCIKLTEASGWHVAIINVKESVLLDRFTSDSTPLKVFATTAGQHTDNSIELFEEQIDAAHPYHPFITSHTSGQFGELLGNNGQSLYYRLHSTQAASIQ